MEKEFVPYEIALALKELGFDEPCFGFYNHQGQLILMTQEDENSIQVYKNSYVKLGKQYAVPLHQQAFRWFREKYKLQAEILWRGDMECFCYKTGKFKYGSHDFSKDDYKTYEEAELACLTKLIEIVKNKI